MLLLLGHLSLSLSLTVSVSLNTSGFSPTLSETFSKVSKHSKSQRSSFNSLPLFSSLSLSLWAAL